jgi:C1A family cysteine protease
MSRLFIYYNARVADAAEDSGDGSGTGAVTDSGSTVTSAIETLEDIGCCLESTWPYDISKVNEKPSDAAYAEAPPYKVTEAFQVNLDLTEMKKCLAQGFPFSFGLMIYPSYDDLKSDGIAPMPGSNEQSDGSHCQLAVGYNDSTQSFIVRNSWGPEWVCVCSY